MGEKVEVMMKKVVVVVVKEVEVNGREEGERCGRHHGLEERGKVDQVFRCL